jgi:hypothetical protein
VHGGGPDCSEGGAGPNDTWTFDFSENRWELKFPEDRDATDREGGFWEDKSVYDPATRKVYFTTESSYLYQSGTGGWFVYDFDSNTYTKLNSRGDTGGISLAVDEKRRLIVEIGDGKSRVNDLNSPSLSVADIRTTGATEIVGRFNPGLAYDPVTDRIVAWYGGAAVYSLNMDTYVWSRHQPAASNTVIPAPVSTSGGVYGRFRYIPSRNAFIAVSDGNSAEHSVYLYKLSPGEGVPSDKLPPSTPARLQVR